MIEVTGSRVHRVWRCAASAALPQVIDDDKEAAQEPARGRGKDVHRYLELSAKGEGAEFLATLPEDIRRLCEAIDLSEMPMGAMPEVALAWDWAAKRGRLLGISIGHRDYSSLEYPPTGSEIALTIDVVGVDDGAKVMVIGDYKSGWTRYPAPDEFGQTLLAAAAARSVWPKYELRVALIQIRLDGTSFWVSRDVDPWSLDVFEQELADSMAAARAQDAGGPAAPTREGSHCTHCPAIKSCPSKVALLRSIPDELPKLGVTLHGKDLIFDDRAITMSKAAAAYQAAEAIEEMMAMVKAEVCALAWHAPIELPDGRVIEPHESSKRTLDAEVAFSVLRSRYGEAAKEAVEMDITFASLERLVAAHRKEGEKMKTRKGDGLVDKILDEVTRRGGLTTKITKVCSPHVPRKK